MRARAGAIGIVVAAALAAAGTVQAQQTVSFTTESAGITDGARSGCVGNDRWLNSQFPSIRFAWSDTTGAQAGKVRVDVSVCWGYFSRSNLNLNVLLNDVDQPESIQSPSQPTGNCNQSLTTSATFETGITEWNPDGQNELTLSITGGDVMVFSTNGPFIVEIVVTKLNEAPAAPTFLMQRDVTGQAMAVGGETQVPAVEVRALVTDPDGDVLFLEAEIQPTTVFFTGQPNALGFPVASGGTAAANLLGLADGSYHWQVRSVDPSGEKSPWVSFGSNSEVLADFKVNTAVAVDSGPSDGEDHGGGDCATSVGGASATLAPALLALAILAGFRRRAVR